MQWRITRGNEATGGNERHREASRGNGRQWKAIGGNRRQRFGQTISGYSEVVNVDHSSLLDRTADSNESTIAAWPRVLAQFTRRQPLLASAVGPA